MPSDDQKALNRQFDTFQNLSEEQWSDLRALYREFTTLSLSERQNLRQQFYQSRNAQSDDQGEGQIPDQTSDVSETDQARDTRQDGVVRSNSSSNDQSTSENNSSTWSGCSNSSGNNGSGSGSSNGGSGNNGSGSGRSNGSGGTGGRGR